MRAGTGHSYWKKFEPDIRSKIETLAKDSFNALYEPELPDTFRTLDLPLAGRGYTSEALGLLYQFIHLANGLKREQPSKRGKKKEFAPLPKDDPFADDTGETVIKYLAQARDLSLLVSSKDKASLGLHPAVYSYTATGNFLTSAFFAEVLFVQHIKETIGFLQFAEYRERFEDFLVTYKHFVNGIAHDFGSGMRSAEPIVHFYQLIIHCIKLGAPTEEIVAHLQADERLSASLPNDSTEYRHMKKSMATRRAKSEAKVRTALETAQRCPICNARMHPEHVTIDHVIPRRGGGGGKPDNLEPLHPFCNSGVKESKDPIAVRIRERQQAERS